jgi:hypothetical protein
VLVHASDELDDDRRQDLVGTGDACSEREGGAHDRDARRGGDPSEEHADASTRGPLA